jgi:iron complex outermembrane recepter protein
MHTLFPASPARCARRSTAVPVAARHDPKGQSRQSTSSLVFIGALCGLIALPAFAAEPIEEIVVSATPLRENPNDVAQPAIVVGGDELVTDVATSLGETLSTQLGINATYFGPTASRPVIRGLGGDRVTVLEDSIGSLDVSAVSEDHAVTIDPILAQRVEIIKGPATLMYGNAAVGGVVNVITNRIPEERGDKPVKGMFEVRGDTASNERSVVGRIDATQGNFGFHADAYKRETDNIDIPGHALSDRLREELVGGDEDVTDTVGTLFGSDSDSYGGAAGVSYIGDDSYIGVDVSRFNTNYGTPGPESLPDGGSVRIDMNQTRYDLKGEWDDIGSIIDNIRVRASHNDYFHQEFEADGTPGTIFDQNSNEARVSFDHAKFGQWSGTVGAQIRQIDFAAYGEEAFVPPNTLDNTGLFIFEQRPIGDLSLELGARGEKQTIDVETSTGLPDYDSTSFNGSAGLVWKYTPEYSLAFNVTRSQRHPSPTELYADGPHVAVGRFAIGDPGLDKETALTGDLTLRKYAGPIQFDVTAFASRYGDYIYELPTGEVAGDEETFPVFQYLQQDAHFYGLEGEVSFPLSQLYGGDLKLHLLSDYVRGQLDNGGGNIPLLPPWRFGAELGYTDERLHAGLTTFYYARQDKLALAELPTDAYTMVDFDATYMVDSSLGQLFVFLKGSNLADQEARRSTSPLKDYAPLAGRSLEAGVRLEF